MRKEIRVGFADPPGGLEVGDAPRDMLYKRLAQLGEDLAEVETERNRRVEIDRGISAAVLAKLGSLRVDLGDMPPFNFRQEAALIQRRAGLERDIDSLERELRQEDVSIWRDTARLAEEARRLRSEQRAAQRRLDLISGMEGRLV